MAHAEFEPASDAAASLEAFGYKQELKRTLSLADLLVYGLILISPTAPWAVFGFVYNASKGMAPLVYVVGLVAMLFTALSYMTMARAFPVAGSVYAYAARGIGQSVGFLAGWAMLLDYLLLPTLTYVFAAEAVFALAPGVSKPLLIVGLVAGVTTTNLAGVKIAAWLNQAMLWIQLILLAVFAVLAFQGVSHGLGGAHLSAAPFYRPSLVTPQLLFGALSLAVLSFLGFDAIATLSEEAKGGPRAVSRATLLSLVLAAGLFIAQTWLASLFVLDKTAFPPGDDTANAFLGIAQMLGGTWFKAAASLGGIVISSIACSLVGQAAAARLVYGMARDGRLPRWLSHVHAGRKTPDRAILMITRLTLVASIVMPRHL